MLCLTDIELLAIMTKNDERKGHCELCVLADLHRNDLVACAMCIRFEVKPMNAAIANGQNIEKKPRES